ISGNVMASQKLQALFKLDATKAIDTVMKRRGGAAPATTAAAPATTSKPTGEPTAPKFFAALQKRLAANPSLKSEVRTTITFRVTGPDVMQTFELGGAAQATLTIADGDLPSLSSGNMRSLYQHGKLRVDGDVTVAHRLGFLKGLL